jgi:hypothetical protein
MLHDPHKIPEPILVISGLTYLYPFYLAISKKRIYDASTYIFLTFTTVGFHSTRYEFLFKLDCIAIINFLFRSYYLLQKCSIFCNIIFFLSVIYSLVSYFVGKYYNIMSFHPNWNTQMFYHSLMHIFTSYSSYLIMIEYK